MIRVTRPGTGPAILVKKSQAWRDALLSADTEAKRVRAESKYRHRQVKETLVAMFFGKCAYCESKITHVDYGHIEHFRPKRGPNGRPDLVFEWPNLLLACGICNGAEFKADRFPEAADGGPILDPCTDDPTIHFEFDYDPLARLANIYGKTTRGKTTESLLGLNRPELRAYRSKRIRHLVALSLYVDSDPEAMKLLEEAKQSSAEYAAFARVLFG